MDRLNLIHHLPPKLQAKLQQAPPFGKTWTAIGLAVVICLLSVGLIIYLVLTPSTINPDYYPFANAKEYQQFIKNNPLFTLSPPADATFTIKKDIRSDKKALYTISLSTRPLKPDMTKEDINSYLSYLDNSQQQALQWIKDQGLNPTDLYLTWRPDPQQMRQSLLGETDKTIPQKQ